MDKLSVFLLVASPFLGFFGWAIWWLVTDSMSERRRARSAGCGIEPRGNDEASDERSRSGQASAA
jgi:hypothetical protein